MKIVTLFLPDGIEDLMRAAASEEGYAVYGNDEISDADVGQFVRGVFSGFLKRSEQIGAAPDGYADAFEEANRVRG